jgi:hypothetical protein
VRRLLAVTNPLHKARVAFKRWLSRRRLVVEFCKDCGREQPLVWWTDDNQLWLDLMKSTGGVACPECFDRRALRAGILLRWQPVVEHRDQPEVTTC